MIYTTHMTFKSLISEIVATLCDAANISKINKINVIHPLKSYHFFIGILHQINSFIWNDRK